VKLVGQAPKDRQLQILVHSGTADNFYKDGQLRPESLQEVTKGRSGVEINLEEGYDHSYWFISVRRPTRARVIALTSSRPLDPSTSPSMQSTSSEGGSV
jgi:hypothetical protein